MKTETFNYDLPQELIAQQPTQRRGDSRMLVLRKSENVIVDDFFVNIKNYLKSGDCLVLNDTKVLWARFFGRRKSGAKIEGLFLGQNRDGWEIMLKNARKVRAGEELIIFDTQGNDFITAQAEPIENQRWLLKIKGDTHSILEKIGFAPLPPYIKRQDPKYYNELDKQRYQTVYAQRQGAVAAPTAGLHFTEEIIESLKALGIKIAYVTLHTGAGTFQPVTAENIQDHKIHSEYYQLDQANAEIINLTKQKSGRIIAVGTTSVRTLETIADYKGLVLPAFGNTELFILPGYKFKIVDAMITNFHLPKSTLLALVSAFAGVSQITQAYQHAIKQKYRFFSYGDAMLIV